MVRIKKSPRSFAACVGLFVCLTAASCATEPQVLPLAAHSQSNESRPEPLLAVVHFEDGTRPSLRCVIFSDNVVGMRSGADGEGVFEWRALSDDHMIDLEKSDEYRQMLKLRLDSTVLAHHGYTHVMYTNSDDSVRHFRFSDPLRSNPALYERERMIVEALINRLGKMHSVSSPRDDRLTDAEDRLKILSARYPVNIGISSICIRRD